MSKTLATKSPSPARVVIRASAGTGKTYRLTGHYLQLLVDGVPPRNILATTFTRKAAGEIFDRILLRLAQAALTDEACQQLAAAIARPQLTVTKCQELLTSILSQLDALQVGTLDSFFARIATSLALELSLPLGWSICEYEEDLRMRRDAIEAVLDTEKTSDLLTLVNLLFKGEARRGVSDLVLDTVNSLYSLYRETSRDAWQKIPALARVSHSDVEAAIDCLSEFPMTDKRFDKSRVESIAAIEAEDFKLFLEKGIPSKLAAGEDKFYGKEIPPPIIAIYRTLIQHAASQLVHQVAMQTEATWQLLDHFAGVYQRLQREHRSLRFDDVTQQLAAGLDSSKLAQSTSRLGTRIEHLLLDEFQDTSLTQWRVLLPIATQMLATHPASTLLCVGDVKQAIYGWRGGLASIFAAVQEQLPEIASEELATSYRCSQPVIDCVNLVFKNLLQHTSLENASEAVKKWQTTFPQHSTAKKELSGYVALHVAPAADEGETQKRLRLQYAANLIAQLAAAHPTRSLGVLVRKNDTVAEMMLLLRQRSVRASEEGGNALCDSAPVEIILSALRLAEHPADSVARFHLAHSPLGHALGFDADQYDDTGLAAEISARIRRDLLEQGYGKVVLAWARILAPHCQPRDEARLGQLVEMAYQLGNNPSLRIERLIEIIETRRVSDPAAAKVRVMTVHQAKGLEFDLVVLPELDESLTGQVPMFVTGRSSPYGPVDTVCRYANKQTQQQLGKSLVELFQTHTDAAVTESLCVMYVAMTRAIHAMYMVVDPPTKTGTLKRDYAGLLKATLTTSEVLPNSVAFETGEETWRPDHAAIDLTLDPVPDDYASEIPTIDPIDIAKKPAFPPRLVDRVSPSELEGGPKVRMDFLLGTSDRLALARGTLIHGWMELVDWTDKPLPTDEALRASDYAASSEPAELDAMIAEFRRYLAQPAIRELLSTERYAEHRGELQLLREHPFAVRDGEQLLTGSFDRVVLWSQGGKVIGAEVIDFKTDHGKDADELSSRVAFYTPQLRAYRRAIMSLYHLPESQVTLTLAFLKSGTIEAVA